MKKDAIKSIGEQSMSSKILGGEGAKEEPEH